MNKYYSGKLEITALQFNGGWENDGALISDWLQADADYERRPPTDDYPARRHRLVVFQNTGNLYAYTGDWVIRFPDGYFTVLNDAAFNAQFSVAKPVPSLRSIS